MKLPYQVKYEVQSNVIDIEIANTSACLKLANIVDSQLSGVKLFHTISPSQMAEYQKKDNQLSIVHECVANNHKPKLSEIHRIWLKPIRHLLVQFDRLSIIQGFCIIKLSGMMMNFNNLFFLLFCVTKFSSHFMMTVVIKVYSVL